MLPRLSLPSARRLLAVPSTRLLTAAYFTAFLSSLVSTSLTYVYVGAGARELNPVLAVFIHELGLWLALLFRTLVLVGCYWIYTFLAAQRLTGAVSFAWSGAVIHLADAGHDLRVALLAGPRGDPDEGLVVLMVVCLTIGLVFRPPSLAAPRPIDDR